MKVFRRGKPKEVSVKDDFLRALTSSMTAAQIADDALSAGKPVDCAEVLAARAAMRVVVEHLFMERT